MTIVTRFAPSPTGLLHVGNVRTALINWLYARSQNGKFILRIDDTDSQRSSLEFLNQIKFDLSWLGLEWDSTFRQSERMERYNEAKKMLIDSGRLYPCYETQEELSIKRKSLLSRNLPPIYDRASLKLTKEQKLKLEGQGITPHWRFLLEDKEIIWEDRIRGVLRFNSSALSDPILIKTDGSMTYTIASVVDDIDFAITDIVRGEDHLSNSATHIQIFEALGVSFLPSFAHTCLLQSKDQEISKRIGGFDISSLRSNGIEAMSLNSFLAKIGTSDNIEYKNYLKELVEEFSFSKFSRSSVNYSLSELERLNTKLIHSLSYDIAKHRLIEEGVLGIDESFWELVKPNIKVIKEAKDWWSICNAKISPIIVDIEFTKLAATLLPKDNWNDKVWEHWIELVKSMTTRSGKDLFNPIRLALTGAENGPELKRLLPILGYDKAFARLTGEAA